MTRPGGITDYTEIKFFILYILDYCHDRILDNDLSHIIRTDDFVDFFEYSAALVELLETKHVVSSLYEGNTYYTITPLGLEALSLFQHRLKPHVRSAAAKAADAVLAQSHRDSRIRSEYVALPHGEYLVCLSFFDEDVEDLSIRLKAPSKATAISLCDNFSRNAERTVLAITDILGRK